MKEHLLVILPHPDDEALGVAGLISLKRKQQVPVTYACATLGEMGRSMGKPVMANRETLRDIRKKELLEVAKILDITDLRMLGYRDKTLEFEDDEKLANHFLEIIEEVQPTHIVTFYPGFAVHPDHDACGAAVIRAVKRIEKEKRPIVYCIAFSNDRFEHIGYPDVLIDIREVADLKLKAIKAHQSQTFWMVENIEQNERLKQLLNQEVFWTYKWDD
ncbi:bacillithiol biosynthesis deacetylase BshB2 [Bacillus alveayuensis]|jgi:N-acetylglucosamine malate deacetylase 2|uniref:Bacillithiol biosynthesis deacetylase BshB2 n=1 Tax=Aeribacillus alveayuensis TaxID=279215 RepID=A0ABT9VPH6_9BACI|nr:bacillithiol biosynthesis deacetylase BshB2 [Bacillus alveayuensis]MDQ0162752.1 bacillithiol biosynthesis deacetylase BshB2 [Bacillus alveayuensis]